MLIKRFKDLFDSHKKRRFYTIIISAILLFCTLGISTSCIRDTALIINDIIIYENEELGFSISFPKEWKDRYIIKEIDNRIEVSSKKNFEFGGLLFTIERLIGELITEEDIERSPSKEVIILKGNGYTYIVRYPSDMQYPPDNEELIKEYKSMFEQIPSICKTIDILGNECPKASNEGFKVVGSSFFTMEIPKNWEIQTFTDWPLLWEIYLANDEIKENEEDWYNQKDNTIVSKMNKIGEIEIIPYKSEELNYHEMTTVYITDEEIFSKVRISLDNNNSNGEIMGKIKDSFVMTGGFYNIVDLQTDAQRYLDGGGKKVFGKIESFEVEDEYPVAVQINVMDFIPDGPDDNNPNGFYIKDLNKRERYPADSGVSIAPLIAPNYNTYGVYEIFPLDQTFIESQQLLKDSFYYFIIGRDGQLKIMLQQYIP